MLLTALFKTALCQEARPTFSPREPKVHLVYDDSTLSEQSLQQLAVLLAKEPKEVWFRTAISKLDVSFEKLVENHYHISTVGTSGRKTVAETLITSIKGANPQIAAGLHEGTEIIIPPVPPHAYNWNESPPSYIRVSPMGSSRMRAADRMSEITATEKLIPPQQERAAVITAKEISNASIDDLVRRAWDNPSQPVLPAGIHAFDDGGLVSLRFNSSQTTMCDQDEDWLADSPFITNLKKRLSAPNAKANFSARAKERPFVIIDWVSAPKNHGKKVKSVVRYFLKSIGAPDLPVTLVDLNPTNNRSDLTVLFERFLSQYFCLKPGIHCTGKSITPEVKDARAWLLTNPGSGADIEVVPQLLLEAVFWTYFRAQKSWVNMSFSIDSPSLDIMHADYLTTSQSFGIAAASDSHSPDGPIALPQRAASVYPNFVNVTYGNRNGMLIGGASNLLSNMMVTTVGQGCGFEFEDIKKADEGTSFAAPFVAAASWVKYLLDGITEDQMRKVLVKASSVSNEAKRADIESAGPLDPARLLLGDQGGIILTDGTLLDTSQPKLTLKYKKQTGSSVTEEFAPGDDATISFYKTNANVDFVRIRTPRTPPPILPYFDTNDFELDSAVFDFKDSTGVMQEWDLKQHTIRMIAF